MSDTKNVTDNHTSIKHLIDDHHASNQSSHSKEGEPARPRSVEKLRDEEYIAPENEPTIEDKELEKYIEIERDVPEIHPDLKKAGLQALDTTSLDPKQRVRLPIADEEIMNGLDEPLSSSFRWLAEFALFMLKRAHLALKRVHGKVVRVIQK
ncbi:hypothetical protein IPM65_02855 [Candidatus Roizmanbacteria bacterium]|nr:MAG: hypothetical protein IPM65_02855 [Candidatus Roizmanbacteria bacterium]